MSSDQAPSVKRVKWIQSEFDNAVNEYIKKYKTAERQNVSESRMAHIRKMWDNAKGDTAMQCDAIKDLNKDIRDLDKKIVWSAMTHANKCYDDLAQLITIRQLTESCVSNAQNVSGEIDAFQRAKKDAANALDSIIRDAGIALSIVKRRLEEESDSSGESDDENNDDDEDEDSDDSDA